MKRRIVSVRVNVDAETAFLVPLSIEGDNIEMGGTPRKILSGGVAVENQGAKPKDPPERKGCCGGGKRLVKGAGKLLQSELGIFQAEEDVIQARRKMCMECPEFDFGLCKQCGCYLYAKTRLKKERCPLNKWPAT
jgi:hypothetical protein